MRPQRCYISRASGISWHSYRSHRIARNSSKKEVVNSASNMEREFMERVLAALEAIQATQNEILAFLYGERRHPRAARFPMPPADEYQQTSVEEIQGAMLEMTCPPEAMPQTCCGCARKTGNAPPNPSSNGKKRSPNHAHRSGLPCRQCEPGVVREKPKYPPREVNTGPICPVANPRGAAAVPQASGCGCGCGPRRN